MGHSVKPQNYVECVCGQVCKGRAALANHGRRCTAEQVRSAMHVYCAAEDLPPVSDTFVRAHLEVLRDRLADLPYGHPAAGMVSRGN